MGMTIKEAITRYKDNAEYEWNHGNLQGCLEFKQLVEWLEQLQKIQKLFHRYDKGELTHDMFGFFVGKVLEDENDN